MYLITISENINSIDKSIEEAFEYIIGHEPVMTQLRQWAFDVGASRVRHSLGLPADVETPFIVLQGNSGTGKTIIAEILAGRNNHLIRNYFQ